MSKRDQTANHIITDAALVAESLKCLANVPSHELG